MSLAFLACSYLWVRRLERPLLRLLWLYALAVAVVKLSGVLLLFAWLEEIIGTQGWEVVGWFIVWVLASLLIMLLILVALARMASRRGFDKALHSSRYRHFQGGYHGKLGGYLLLAIWNRIRNANTDRLVFVHDCTSLGSSMGA